MANPRGSAVEEIDQADALTVSEFGTPLSAEAKSTAVSAGSGMGFRHTVREVMRMRMAKFAAIVLFVTVIAAVFAPWLAPYDPTKSKPWDSLQAPSSKYWLGADRLGRDQLSRLIYGARISLMIGVAGVSMAVVLGVLIGVTAGWYGHLWDGGHHGSGRVQHHLGGGHRRHAMGGACHPQPGAIGARARVHHGGHRDGCPALAYYAQASDPKLHGPSDRPG